MQKHITVNKFGQENYSIAKESMAANQAGDSNSYDNLPRKRYSRISLKNLAPAVLFKQMSRGKAAVLFSCVRV